MLEPQRPPNCKEICGEMEHMYKFAPISMALGINSELEIDNIQQNET